MAKEIPGAWINEVLHVVKTTTDDGDEQLSILARALVVACQSCGVEESVAVQNLQAMFRESVVLVPLAEEEDRDERSEEVEVAAVPGHG